MSTTPMHPLEERFIKLSILKKMLTPGQVTRCQRILAERVANGEKSLGLEQVFQEEGLLTDDESELLWELIANSADTRIREQIAERKGTEPGPPARGYADAEEAGIRISPQAKTFSLDIPKKIGGYEVLEWIGRGGMGAVYRARQVNMERDVALKLLPPDLASNAKYIRRFVREARAAGRLNHGNLVGVYDVGEADGIYYISMEYVEGRTVKQMLGRVGRMGVVECLRIVEQVALALECAHRYKIIHRDIKPDNIMIDKRGEAKLCDLGLAKWLEGGPLHDTDTQEGHTMGTPHYMSPEQARAAGKVDARSDLFSLGATLYHMVTGRVPFEGDTPIEVLMRVTGEPALRPDRIDPLLPPPLTKLIMRLLAKNPDERPANARVVYEEAFVLRRDIEDGRVFVFEDAARPQLGRPIPAPSLRARRRHKNWKLGMAGALVFLLLCGLVRLGKSTPPPPPPPPPLHAKASGKSPKNPGNADNKAEQSNGETETHTVPEADTDSRKKFKPNVAQQLMLWMDRLDSNPGSWRRILANIEDLEPEIAEAGKHEQTLLATLKRRVFEQQAKVATAGLKSCRAGAKALERAGLFRQAAELFLDMSPDKQAAPGMAEAIRKETTRLAAAGRRDAAEQASNIEEIAEAGLLRVADMQLRRWQAELKRDGSPKDSERRRLMKEAEARLRDLKKQDLANRMASESTRLRLEEGLKDIRSFTSKHEFDTGKDVCRKLLANRPTAPEQRAYEYERDRLAIVQDLFKALRKAINENPGRIRDKDFIQRTRVSGFVSAMDERGLTLKSRGLVAKVGLSEISRESMRGFFIQVFERQRLIPNEPLGRAAYDLGDPSANRARQARRDLVAIARQNPLAQRLLERVMAYEAYAARDSAAMLLIDAEEQYLKARYKSCQRAVAAAMSALGTQRAAAIQARAQRLLMKAAEARAAGAASGGRLTPTGRGRSLLTFSATELIRIDGDWSWQEAPPKLLPEGGLAFGTELSRATPAWRLVGPARLALSIRFPVEARGGIQMTVASKGEGDDQAETWSLVCESIPNGLEAWLARANDPKPIRITVPEAERDNLRLWISLDVGFVSWGIGQQEQKTQRTTARPDWDVHILAKGGLVLNGLEVEGKVVTRRDATTIRREFEKTVTDALERAGGSRDRTLRRLLDSHGCFVSLGSKICASMSETCWQKGQAAEARYWASRALYECPSSMWPEETRRIKELHRRWQEMKESYGPPAPDPLEGYPYPSYKLPGEQKPAPIKEEEVEDEEEGP